MGDSLTCLTCQGTNLKSGTLLPSEAFFSTVRGFRPAGGHRRSSKNHVIPVNATMCIDCGFVEITGDPEDAKAVVKRIGTGG